MTVFGRVVLSAFVSLFSGAAVLAQCPVATDAIPTGPVNINVAPEAIVDFKWTPDSNKGVTGYLVKKASDDSTLCTPRTPTDTVCTVSLKVPGSYDWYVEVSIDKCVLKSAVAPLTVGCLDGPPIPRDPPDRSTGVSTSIALAWSDVIGVDHYDVYFGDSKSGACASPKPIFQTRDTKYDPGPLSAGTDYEWKVVAVSAVTGCPPAEMACATFQTVVCPTVSEAAPASPVGNNVAVNAPITFSWSPANVAGVAGYDVVSGPTLAVLCSALATATSCTSDQGVPLPGTYEWGVRTNFTTACNPVLSAKVQFTAGCPVAPPIAVGPISGDTNVPLNTSFKWMDVGAEKYDVYLGVGAACSGIPVATVSGTSFSPSGLLQPSTTYDWRVVAITGTCPPQAMACARFQTAACPSDPSVPVDPASGATITDRSVTFSWKGVATATGYDVMTSTDGATFVVTASTSGPTSTMTSAPLPPGDYAWLVRTRFGQGCPPVDSTPSRFTVVAPCNNSAPTLIAPTAGEIVTLPVKFGWNGVAGATSYNVYALSAASTVPTLIGSTTATSLTSSSLPTGDLEWFVRAFFDGCPAVDSAHGRFSVKRDVSCPTGNAVLELPKNGTLAITSPVHFDWDGVLNAIGYRLIISFNGGSPTAIGLTKDTELDSDIPAGKIEWFVETQFDNCPSTESAHFTFTTVEAPTCPVDPGTAKPIAPADGAANVTSPVTFQWSAVTGATGYRVLASFDGSSSTPIASTAATQATVAVPQGTIVWLVEALFGDCPSTFSPRTTFTVSTPTQCNTTPTSLVSPANGASGVASPVVFEWKEVAGAVEYELFASTNGKEYQLLGSTERTALERIVLPGTIDWYVVTEFKGCPEQRSEVFRFKVGEITTCGDGTIDLKSPQDGATVTSPATFAWSAVAGASFYRVWVAIDEGAPAALARTTDTSVVLSLPSGKADWYVEAVFAGCPSILSARARFAITAAANCDANQPVTIESPVPSSGGEPPEETSPVDLRWRPSERARGYRVWVAIAGQPFADVGFTTETHLMRELKPGKYEWYVDAYFDSCPPVASKHAFFTIESTTLRCGNDSAVLVSPADGSNNVGSPVTFLWSSVANGDDYRVFVSLDGADFILLGETDETSMTRPIPPGDIVWYVETTFEGCTSTVSQKSRFSIARAANCNLTDAPRLVSPADGATNVPSLATFDWDAVSGATGYLLFAVVGDDGATALAETEDTSVQKYVPVGTIEWWVVAFRGGCPPVESKHFRFSSASPDQCTNRRPILVSPADNARGLLSPVHFSWTAVENATGYKLWAEVDKTGLSPIATTTATQAGVELPSGRIRWFVEANFASCPPTASAEAAFDVIKTAPACGTPDAPVITVPGQVVAESAYTVRWYPVANANVFELQEAKKLDFSDAITTTVDGLSFSFTHTATDTPVQYLYRVRAVSACSEDRGAYSNVIGIFIIPPAAKNNASAEIGTPTSVIQTIFLPGSSTPVAFTARSDKPWVAITPSSGILGPPGLTLVVTADPSALALGTNTGTVIIEYAESGKNGAAHASRTSSSSVSVSLVTPVSAKGKNTPLPDSLIIPAVAHTAGANGSMFESDIRLANTSAQTMKYQVFFTPSGVDGTQTGSATTIQVDAGATMALDDILATFFGAGSDGKGVTGMMEIRPITTSSTTASLTSSGRGRTTVASSRTYNVTENGTYGQFIPAIPYSQFIAKSASATRAILSLQQISQSANYRMNFGLVEASGEPVSVLLSVFDDKNKKVAEIPKSLQASEHRQFNGLLAENGLTLENGRVEVEVTSPTGRVTAYASVVDNRTNDPLLVWPVLRSAEAGSTRFVLPSIGDFDIGFAHWKSDIRLFNAGSSPAALTLSYYPQGNPAQPSTITATLQPGEVRAFDNFIETNFNKKATAGSLVVTSAAPANIVATAKTYTASATGTFGQFIPGVTPDQSIAAGSPALQILQLEQSGRFRTNIGVAETSGKPAVAEIAVIVPGAKTVPRIQIPLAANEFRQISLLDFNLGTVYNARATVKVMSGTGTVTAYGSVIDQLTQDPTYVPAQ